MLKCMCTLVESTAKAVGLLRGSWRIETARLFRYVSIAIYRRGLYARYAVTAASACCTAQYTRYYKCRLIVAASLARYLPTAKPLKCD